MTKENGVPIPGPLRASLQDEPPDKRRHLENVWNKLPETERENSIGPDVDDAWNEISRRVDELAADRGRAGDARSTETDRQGVRKRRSDRGRRSHNSRRIGRRAARIGVGAAVIAILLVTGIWMVNQPTVYESAAGDQRTVQLSDGSIVELNSDSRLRIGGSLQNTILSTSRERHVVLEGEAYFRVASRELPFVVETEDARLRVTGTEFNVRARRTMGERSTRVTLVSGALQVSARSGDGRSVALDAPGATASVDASTQLAVASGNEGQALDHVLAWRRHGFAFTDTPIAAILDEIERRFGMRIDPRGGVDLYEPMNLFYSRGVTPEQILNDVCFEQDCKYRPTSRGFALVPSESGPSSRR